MAIEWERLLELLVGPLGSFLVSVGILVVGAVLGYLVWKYSHRLMKRWGIAAAVEGTPFDRSARSLGTSTVGIVANLLALFVYVGAVLLAFNVSSIFRTAVFWSRLTSFLPNLFVAILAIITGLIAGDKASLVVAERLKSIKLPEVGLVPELVKYSIIFLAVLVALGQLGVATNALLILLGAYAFGIVFIAGVAFKDLLSAAAAGLYLVLREPYGIGDEVEIDDRHGVVQEVDLFATTVENDDGEYVIPNQLVFRAGVVIVR